MKPNFTIILVLLCYTISTAQLPDTFAYTQTISLLINGNITDIDQKRERFDQTTTGLLGIRYNNDRITIDVTYNVLSSQPAISSSSTRDFGRAILNPFNANVNSFRAQLRNSNITNRGFIIRTLEKDFYQRKITYAQKDTIIDLNPKLKQFTIPSRIGYILDGGLSNFDFVYQDSLSMNGNVIDLTFLLTWPLHIPMDKDFDVKLIPSLGVTYRGLSGDLTATNEFRKEILNGVERKHFFTHQVGFEMNLSDKFFGKISYPVFYNQRKILGFTNGQPIFVIGIYAELGRSKTRSFKYKEYLEYWK